MAHNVIKSLSEDFVHCDICTEPYNEPKVLPCLHSFCLQCLKQWASNRQSQPFSCPTCRCSVNLPSKGIAGLPKNFFLVSLMERLEEANALSKQHQDFNCNICRTKLSTMFCLDCKMHICHGCKETHDRLTRTKEHPLIPSDKLSDVNYLQKVISTQAPYCNTHLQERVRYYCTQCSHLCCLVCAVVSHQGHRSLQEVEGRVSSVKADLESLLKKGKTQANDVVEKLEHTKKTTEKIKSEISEFRAKIESRYQEFVTKLQSDKKQLEEQLLKMENIECTSLKDIEAEISNWLKAMENTQEMTRKILEQNNSWEILEMQINIIESFRRVQADRSRVDALSLPTGVKSKFQISNITVLKREEQEILRRAKLPSKNQPRNEEQRYIMGDNSSEHLKEENWLGNLNEETNANCVIS